MFGHLNSYSPKAKRTLVNIVEHVHSTIQSRGEYNSFNSRMFFEPEAKNCFSIIFRSQYQGLKNDRLKHKKTDRMQP